MRIGLSIITQAGHDIWSNGIGQNVYHLACLLEGLSLVERVVLINCGDQETPPRGTGAIGTRFPLVPLREAADLIDVAIEMSGALDAEWTARFRARGGRVVFLSCGQPYAALIEPSLFDRPAFTGIAERCDEVWQLPKDRRFAAMMRAIHRCPVHEVPYLWAPLFLEEAMRDAPDGEAFGYRPGTLRAAPARPAIFEPNISPIKMGIIPFMICEEVERRDPAAIGDVRFLNGDHMTTQHSFVYLVEHSDLYKAGKLSIHGRDYFARVMARSANMIVSHQLLCAQNNLYCDALHGGYPLIHNSPLLADAGYYYPESDIEAGVTQFELARREHDRNTVAYADRSRRVLAALDPADRRNRDAYARRLIALCHRDALGKAA